MSDIVEESSDRSSSVPVIEESSDGASSVPVIEEVGVSVSYDVSQQTRTVMKRTPHPFVVGIGIDQGIVDGCALKLAEVEIESWLRLASAH